MNGCFDECSKRIGNRRLVDALVFRVSPMEQVRVTLEKTLVAAEASFKTGLGYKTLIISFGADKCADGTMFSASLCTSKTNNKSSKKRKPIAFHNKPVTDSAANLQQLLGPRRSHLKLVEDNSNAAILRTSNACFATVLSCCEVYKA